MKKIIDDQAGERQQMGRMNGGSRQRTVWQEAGVCALLCFGLAIASFGVFMLRDGGMLILLGDYNTQQIPFTVALRNALADGGLSGWTWNLNLGTSTIQGFSFYALGSPFFWLSTLLPSECFPFLIGWIYALKYGVAGVTAFLYLRCFLHKKEWAWLGALLYAFSGFSTTNLMFYHFHDVIAFFPLIPLAMERMERESDGRLFVFAVFLNGIVNYFFFVGEIIFAVLYFLFRSSSKGFRVRIISAGKYFLLGLWGMGMAAILLVPNVLYVMGNARNESGLFLKNLTPDGKWFLYVLKGLLLPGDQMQQNTAVLESSFKSVAAYLPVVCLAGTLAYLKKERNWLSRLVITLLFISFSPLLSGGFLLYRESNYRWWHMLTLMMALSTCMVLENEDERKDAVWGTKINGILLAAFLLAIVLIPYDEEESLVLIPKRLAFLAGLSGLGVLSVWLLYRNAPGKREAAWLRVPRRHRAVSLLVLVSVYAVVTITSTIWLYKKWWYEDARSYYQRFRLGLQMEDLDDQYRVNYWDDVIVMSGKAAGFANYTSTKANAITSFESLFDYYNKCYAIDKNSIEGLAALLGGKYELAFAPTNQAPLRVYEYEDQSLYVYEGNACPIGYEVDCYLTEEELKDLDVSVRGRALLQAAVISEEDVPRVENRLIHRAFTAEDLRTPLETLIEENQARRVDHFERDGKGFSCEAELEKNGFIFFSVPWDEGWTAWVDGEQRQFLSSGGLILLEMPEGKHSIRFDYETPGYRIGAWVSAISWALYLAAFGLRIRKRREHIRGGTIR